MRKSTFLVIATLFFAIALSACSGGGNLQGTTTPGAFGNGTSTEPGLSNDNGLGTSSSATQPTGLNQTAAPTQSTGTGKGGTSTQSTAPGLSTTPHSSAGGTTAAPTVSTPQNALPTMKPTTAATPSGTGGTPSANAQSTGARLSLLISAGVNTQDGQNVGTVKDVILNLTNHEAQYIVVTLTNATSTGSSTSANAKEIAVPCTLVTINTQAIAGVGTTGNSSNSNNGSNNGGSSYNSTSGSTTSTNSIVLKFDKAALDNAPEFKSDSLPKLGQPAQDWDKDLVDYWGKVGNHSSSNNSGTTGTSPQIQGLSQLQGVVLASEAMGFSINADNGNIIGQIKDFVIDPSTCLLSYMLVSYNAGGNSGDFMIPVPPSLFSLGPTGNTFVIPGADTILNGAPHFNIDQLPDMSISGWDKDIQYFWQSVHNNTSNP